MFDKDPRGLSLLDTGCTIDATPYDCKSLGDAYKDGMYGAEKDPARAARYYERACRVAWVGDTFGWNGCVELGALLQKGVGVAADPTRAVALFTKACDGNDEIACYVLSRSLRERIGAPKDGTRAQELRERACKSIGDDLCKIWDRRPPW
jgi:TPR repeat protein